MILQTLHGEESEIYHNSQGERLGSSAAFYDRDGNHGVHGLGLGCFLSGPGFYFHTFPDTAITQ